MDVVLLRHAPPSVQFQKRYFGHTNLLIDPQLFDHTKIEPLKNLQFSAVYSSDLSRCTQTLQTMGIDHFITDSRLREVRFKPDIEGKTFEEIAQLKSYDPDFLSSPEKWHAYVCEESREMMSERLLSFLESATGDGTILICAHGGTISTLSSILLPDNDFQPLDYLEHRILTFHSPFTVK